MYVYSNCSVFRWLGFFSKIWRPLLHLSLIVCPLALIAQKERIDSLKSVLPSLKDSAKTDCLYNIGIQYIFKKNKDSCLFYINLGYEESKRINYIRGIAGYFCAEAGVKQSFQPQDIKGSEQSAREALKWYGLTGNKKEIEIVYFMIHRVFLNQSLYDSADSYMQLTYYWSVKNENLEWVGNCYEIYRDSGEYEQAFDAFQKIQRLRLQATGKVDSMLENYALGELYRRVENYSTALHYYQKLIKNMDLNKANIWYRVSYPELFALNGKFDSASYYYNQIDVKKCDRHELPFYLVSKGEFYLLQNDYKQALGYFQGALKYHREVNDIVQVNRTLFDLAKCYYELQSNRTALVYTREGLSLSLLSRSKQYIRDGYQMLYYIYEKEHQSDSAFFYYKKYVIQKDLVANDIVKAKFVAYNYEQKINLLGEEGEAQKINLARETFLRRTLIAGILVILLLGIVIFRNIVLNRRNDKQLLEYKLDMQKFENKKAKVELQQKASELEMKALRAQMNPHFIFNSLNSINRFILQNNKAEASGYLSKFSRLVRMILQNSQAPLITLESELESLRLYLELESVRFDHHFEFTISVEEDLEISALKVPPLIIQPYAENAIWHGLMHKEEKGLLQIAFFLEGYDVLCCRITDDGIGRKKSAELKSKSASIHKSMGMQITASRIEMLQQNKNIDAHIKITDLVLPDGSAGGTEVLIKIPVIYD